MFADRERTAHAAYDGTAEQACYHDGRQHVCHRHQCAAHEHLPDAAQATSGVDHIGVTAKADRCGQDTGDQTHSQALHKERQGDHAVGSTHILHDLDLAAAGKNAQTDGAAHRDDADHHQHQHDHAAALGDGFLDLHKDIGHLHRGSNADNARDGLHLHAHALHLGQVAQGDPVVGLKGVVGLKFIPQGGIILHITAVGVEHVLFGNVLHPADPRHSRKGLSYLCGGGIITFGVQIDHRLVLAAQIGHHAAHIHLGQAGKDVQGHTNTQRSDAGNGHSPVLAQVAHTAPGKEKESRGSHHTAATSFLAADASSASKAATSNERSSSAAATGSAGTSETMRPWLRVTTR